jgi:type I restriction enzyme S subunit
MTISSKLGLISQEDKFDRVIAGDSLKKYTQIKKGDFAYNKGNSKTYPMGCIYQLKEKESALVPFVYICFRSKENVDGSFYKQWFLDHGLDRQLNQIITSGARGDGLLNVNTDDFFNLKVPYPRFEEQTAIANVLQTADKELELLKTKLVQQKLQKKGLMQVLLTGKWRVKTE